jgi:hypothetical protein
MEGFQWVKTELEPSETNTIAIDSRAVNKSGPDVVRAILVAGE